jgi:Porphobilinogen deaminase, dipyromethane cofactor binding domain
LKDMSAVHFFSHPAFAIVERDDARDIVIFNADIIEKIVAGKTIIVGTSSPRREEMAVEFLRKALPQVHSDIRIETRSIRGNVEGRLKQLDEGHYDATILATAGLNRLLRSKTDAIVVRELLKDKRLMLLPLIECVPAPCQGAIVAEAHPENKEAVALLKMINDTALYNEMYREKSEAYQYGTGCLQRFGVTTIKTKYGDFLYAAGKKENGEIFRNWQGLPELPISRDRLFSTTDFMGNFFDYEIPDHQVIILRPVVYLSNYKAVLQQGILEIIQSKRIWTAGTKTWLELAKLGIWVEGCADSLGLEFLQPVLSMPILNTGQADVHILTHDKGAKYWAGKNWRTSATYSLEKKVNLEIEEQISRAGAIFWTSIHQYLQYRDILADDVIHLVSSGETASLLKEEGLDPVIFPNIKAFEQWRKSSILPQSAA